MAAFPDSPESTVGSRTGLRKSLRQSLRQKRRQLSVREQKTAARMLCRHILRNAFFRRARHIAFYLPSDGEIDPRPVMSRALRAGKHCYLPVISPESQLRLRFVRYRIGDPLRPNRWGILEPHFRRRNTLPPWALDLVLMPLVGFDAEGGRLGMGKGFYDRSFGFRRKNGRNSPLLAGVAHECQKVGALPVEHWDVPLDLIVSDQAVYPARQS